MGIYHSAVKSAGDKLRAVLDWNATHAVQLPLDLSGLYVDAAGNIGIGTTGPSSKLSFGQDIAERMLALFDDPNDFYGFGLREGYMDFLTGNAINMTIDYSGNVGIGTAVPLRHLDVISSFGENTIAVGEDTTKVFRFLWDNSVHSGVIDSYYSGAMHDFRVGNTTFQASGNVGIGTTAPTSRLQAVGLPIYANNAAAAAGGLTAGAFYRTGADPDPVCVVH